MLSDRLPLALENGAVEMPAEGRIAVVAPSPGADISSLPKERVVVVSRYYPVYRAFADLGYSVAVAPDGNFAMAVICLPRSKAEARALVAEVLPLTNGPVVIDGQKTDGVASMLKELRKRGDVGEVLSKAHGKLFTVRGAECRDWVAKATKVAHPMDPARQFMTSPGVFSADGVDPGSAALAKALPDAMKGHVVDLGAGWGFLSDAILKRNGVTRLDLVEADHAALDAARQNISDPRAAFHWADALTFRPDAAVDHVVTNPPFHAGRAAEPSLGQGFIRASASILKPRGHLWLVANRHLPYEKTLEAGFRSVRLLGQTAEYKLFTATQPRTPRKG